MSKHTPGPWTVNGCRVEATSGAMVAGVFDGTNANVTDRDAEQANARLIAAAPELLESLESALYGVEGNHPLDADIHSWQDAARLAIAKAKGEQA